MRKPAGIFQKLMIRAIYILIVALIIFLIVKK